MFLEGAFSRRGSKDGLKGAGTGVASRSVLQHFLDDFVSESLLPRVMADAKALTQSILSQKSAFLPSSTQVSDAGGAFVLQVAPLLTAHTSHMDHRTQRSIHRPANCVCCEVPLLVSIVVDENCAGGVAGGSVSAVTRPGGALMWQLALVLYLVRSRVHPTSA